ncbi:MAG TPA: S41 family peptidase [Longimicrobiales bacterium]
MKRFLIIAVALVAISAGGWVANDRVNFDRSAWLADYEQLRSAVEAGYANLQWTRPSKNVDLVTLNATALQQLQGATSNSEARQALQTFISGFDDGHFRIERNPPRPIAAVMSWFERDADITIDFKMSASDACSAFGFGAQSHDLAVEGAEPLANATFAAAMLTSARGGKYGVIRIPLFQQREYGAVCEKAWPQFQAGRTGQCDENCQDDFNVVVKHEVAQALADDARALAAAGANAIVIDLTGNGGGTEWAEFAAAALTGKPLQLPQVALVRAISDSANTTCDLSALWKDRNYQPACWNVVPSKSEPHETRAYARPYQGPLYIMTDPNTASASEQFAATLQDNGVARTIGQHTMGVGCGYVDGGNPVTLKNSGIVVWMPNCARFRADGSNEFDGVKPDYPADWGSDAASKTRVLLSVLDRMPR